MGSEADAGKTPRHPGKEAEKQRLAEALRENLRRRKTQDRSRRAASTEAAAKLPQNSSQ